VILARPVVSAELKNICEWLKLTIGTFGTMTLSLVLLYVVTTLIFNPNLLLLTILGDLQDSARETMTIN
jgi:hypothetical protein